MAALKKIQRCRPCLNHFLKLEWSHSFLHRDWLLQQGQTQPAYHGPNQGQHQSDYISGQQPSYGQPNPNALADQFGQKGLGPKRFALQIGNSLTSPPDPRELSLPPPEIRSKLYCHAFSACQCRPVVSTIHIERISKYFVFGLQIRNTLGFDHQSLSRKRAPVPLVTDTVIARCHRCRTFE